MIAKLLFSSWKSVRKVSVLNIFLLTNLNSYHGGWVVWGKVQLKLISAKDKAWAWLSLAIYSYIYLRYLVDVSPNSLNSSKFRNDRVLKFSTFSLCQIQLI